MPNLIGQVLQLSGGSNKNYMVLIVFEKYTQAWCYLNSHPELLGGVGCKPAGSSLNKGIEWEIVYSGCYTADGSLQLPDDFEAKKWPGDLYDSGLWCWKKPGRRVSNQYSCDVPIKCNEGLQQGSGDRSD